MEDELNQGVTEEQNLLPGESQIYFEEPTFTFRHKTIRRFSTAGFEFKNYEIQITGERERARFLEVIRELPPRDGLQIVEVNEAARAASETQVFDPNNGQQTAIRGAMNAADILTAKDRAALGAAGVSAGPSTPTPNLAPNAGKPAGFTGLPGFKL